MNLYDYTWSSASNSGNRDRHMTIAPSALGQKFDYGIINKTLKSKIYRRKPVSEFKYKGQVYKISEPVSTPPISSSVVDRQLGFDHTDGGVSSLPASADESTTIKSESLQDSPVTSVVESKNNILPIYSDKAKSIITAALDSFSQLFSIKVEEAEEEDKPVPLAGNSEGLPPTLPEINYDAPALSPTSLTSFTSSEDLVNAVVKAQTSVPPVMASSSGRTFLQNYVAGLLSSAPSPPKHSPSPELDLPSAPAESPKEDPLGFRLAKLRETEGDVTKALHEIAEKADQLEKKRKVLLEEYVGYVVFKVNNVEIYRHKLDDPVDKNVTMLIADHVSHGRAVTYDFATTPKNSSVQSIPMDIDYPPLISGHEVKKQNLPPSIFTNIGGFRAKQLSSPSTSTSSTSTSLGSAADVKAMTAITAPPLVLTTAPEIRRDIEMAIVSGATARVLNPSSPTNAIAENVAKEMKLNGASASLPVLKQAVKAGASTSKDVPEKRVQPKRAAKKQPIIESSPEEPEFNKRKGKGKKRK